MVINGIEFFWFMVFFGLWFLLIYGFKIILNYFKLIWIIKKYYLKNHLKNYLENYLKKQNYLKN